MVHKTEIKIGMHDVWHDFFNYIETSERKKIYDDENNIVVSVYIDEKLKYCAIIEALPEQLHLRDLGGNFTQHMGILESFMMCLGRFWQKRYLSFNTARKGVEKIAMPFGFKMNNHGDFVKEVI